VGTGACLARVRPPREMQVMGIKRYHDRLLRHISDDLRATTCERHRHELERLGHRAEAAGGNADAGRRSLVGPEPAGQECGLLGRCK